MRTTSVRRPDIPCNAWSAILNLSVFVIQLGLPIVLLMYVYLLHRCTHLLGLGATACTGGTGACGGLQPDCVIPTPGDMEP